MKVKLTFTEPLLGTCPGNKEVATEFVLSNRPDGIAEDENATLATNEEALEKQSTIFAKTPDGKPHLWDYQIKGFFKDACSMLNRVMPKSAQLKAYKKVVDGLIFIKPRQIPIFVIGKMEILERPLRAQTAQGERIALSRSEMIAPGSNIEFEIILLDPKLEKPIVQWLDYGALRGLGQWRNASYGRFSYEVQ